MTKKEERELKRQEKLSAETARVEAMCVYEKQYADYTYICGIDEAGRGPLAGPVVAGAVILPKDFRAMYINDSKKLTPKRRDELFDSINEKALSVATGLVSPGRIDEDNILQATILAMKMAVVNLKLTPDLLLIDALTLPETPTPQVPIIKGDAKSISIAAASIIAKVTRDRLMIAYDEIYPMYGFAKHKGYGTAEHIAALKKYGPCPIHRRSFIKHFIEE